jgi:DNA-binding CsgD family transcriptional regulator
VVVIDRSLTGRAAQQPVVSLTVREEQVLWLIRQGLTNEEIGDELRLTRSTIQFHVSNILTKLAARNRVEIVARAEQLGL